MATAPFSIAETTPADDDVVSQFPTAERTFRDVVESWLLVEHDTSGLHKKVSYSDLNGSTPAGTADYVTVWQDTGILKMRYGTGTVYDLPIAEAGLAYTDSGFLVGDGTKFVLESGSTARTSLGLGSIATQAASSVAITGGSITGITDLAVADGGTGASSASAARTNLGIVVYDVYTGSDVDNVSFPIGSYVVAQTSSTVDRNASATVRLHSTLDYYFTTSGGGTALSGTWKARGYFAGASFNFVAFQRTA